MLYFLLATGDDFACLHTHDGIGMGTVRHALEGSRTHRLWVRQNAIWAATLGEGIWCSYDGGTLWNNLAPPLPASQVWSFAVGAPREDGRSALYAGGDEAALLVSHDGSKRWERLDNLWLLRSASTWRSTWNSPRVLAIAPHPLHPDWLLVSLEDVGVVFSSDGGFSWDEARPNAGDFVREVLWHGTRPERALAWERGGVTTSADGGWTWQEIENDFGGEIVAATFDNHRANWLVLARENQVNRLWSGDDGAWKEIALPELNGAATCVAAHETWWALGLENGAIWTSQNAGRQWTQLRGDGRWPEKICDLKIVPTAPKIVSNEREAA